MHAFSTNQIADILHFNDKGSEFYNRSMKSWLEKNAMEIYSTHNEGKSAVAERFIRTFKKEIFKYMTLISKNVCIYELTDLVKKIQQCIS